MSDNSNSSGCWGWIQSVWAWLVSIWEWILALVFCYSIAIGILTTVLKVKEEELPVWAYFTALLLAIPVMFLLTYLLNGFISILNIIFTWLTTILTGTLLLIGLVYLHLHLWIMVAGLIFFIIGGMCAREARNKESAPWAINSLGAYFLALVMIVVGIVKIFLDKGT